MTTISTRYLNLGLSILGTFSAPLQYLLDVPQNPKLICKTHKFCNLQALSILEQHGHTEHIHILTNHLPALQEGVVWADLQFKNINHFFNPITKKGLWHFSPGVYDFSVYLTKACRLAKKQDLNNSFFFLGAAAHLLQDMSVPHHVCGYLFHGHKKFERWVENHLEEFFFDTPAMKQIKSPIDLLYSDAMIARDFISQVEESSSEKQYRYAAETLLPLACISSAQLFEWFIKTKITTM